MGDTTLRWAVASTMGILWVLAAMGPLPAEVCGQPLPQGHVSGRGCRPADTPVQRDVLIVCEGVNPQVLQPLNAVLATTERDLHGTIREAEAWVRTYHAVVQRLAEVQEDDDLVRGAHDLVQAGKFTEAGGAP